jgi:cytochrome P450
MASTPDTARSPRPTAETGADRPFNLIHPGDYARSGYPHEDFARLRREDPVHFYRASDEISFWAITKHADLLEVSKQPTKFLSNPMLTIQLEIDINAERFPDTLINLDPPKHQVYRRLVSSRFTPGYLKKYHHEVNAIAKKIVDDLIVDHSSGECDFVEAVAAPLPIAVIGWLLGLPESDWPLLYDWTNRIVGAGDPEFQTEGRTPIEGARAAMGELFSYFKELVAHKQAHPADDLVTLFSTCEVDGEKLPFIDVLAWCFLITVAGNETTRNATSGGILAFIEHQDQLRRLQRDPDRWLKPGVEEVLRWTSPIIHFARTAAVDYELHGKRIAKGDLLALFYPSANRDVAFGIGEHFCLGSHLARLELMVAYRHLLPRIEEIRLNGPVERLRSSLVGGVKHLPIEYTIKE